jgi:hypothetical protein
MLKDKSMYLRIVHSRPLVNRVIEVVREIEIPVLFLCIFFCVPGYIETRTVLYYRNLQHDAREWTMMIIRLLYVLLYVEHSIRA